MEYEYNTNEQTREAYSLLELNNRVKHVLQQAIPETCWIRAEMSDVRCNASSGHCYLEFIEKHPVSRQLVARARGSIWAKTFRMLKPYFEMETGQLFASGLKVLVKVSVEFHELYGYSLTVLDIDPAYTVGDLIRKRQEIIRQLKEEGVFSLNKELSFPTLPKRIAVITSPTAAGYEDFLNQLTNNKAGYPFYTRLFPALMQGERTEESVIAALDRVFQQMEYFDVVVIIRGGGATSDLSSFDSYLLAANCAQFPLPVITGIGHERDDTVLDLVAHTRMKTPTAVAEFLIARMDRAAEELNGLQQAISLSATDRLAKQQALLQLLGSRLPVLALNQIERNRMLLQRIGNQFPIVATTLLSKKRNRLDTLSVHFKNQVEGVLREQRRWIELTEQFVKMASPDYLLKRGYSLTLRNGKIVKQAEELEQGDELTVRFADGEVQAQVLCTNREQS
jgi:exodeoxyribonuclease VII large subunit